MSKPIRLAVIGAGSAQFSLGLVRDLCLTDSLAGSSIVLMDLDQQRLDATTSLARRYAAEIGQDLKFEQTTNRQKALEGADFVINTALAGGHSREEAERALVQSCGYYRGLYPSESGFFQYDLMLEVARDIERICPDAWLIQSSNPVYDGVTLITRETNVKTVGLCHGPFGGIREIANVLGLDYDQITFEAPGVNHCVWLTSFRYKGEDAFPLLDKWVTEKSEDYWRTWTPKFHDTQMSPAAIHMYKLFGALPLGDASRAIWTDAWWYNKDLESKKRWWGPDGGFDSEIGWQIYLDHLTEDLDAIAAAANDPTSKLTKLFPPKMSGEQMVPIIDALHNDRRGNFIVNVANNGAIDGIPDNVAVEVQAVVDGRGIRPLRTPKLPDLVMLGAIMPQILVMERRLAAFKTKDTRFFLQYLLFEHRTRSLEHAEETLDAIMKMPGNERMLEYFGGRA